MNFDLWFSPGPVPGCESSGKGALSEGEDIVPDPQETKEMVDVKS